MKRIIVTLLLLSMLVSAFSCGSSGGASSSGASSASGSSPDSADSTISDTSAPDTETLSLAESNAAVEDELPDADFEGAGFVITINNFTGCAEGFYTEETTGDALNDAVYERNAKVEERFNVKLDYIAGKYDALPAQVTKSVTAGEDYYQLLNQHVFTAGVWVTGEVVGNWYDIPYVDFEKPWWSESNIDDLTYNGKAFLAVGDLGLTTIGRTYAIYYDTVEAESYGLPDMYSIVYDGAWTIDELQKYSKDVYRDLNNNGERDTVEDFFGFSTSTGSNITAFLWSSGEMIITDGEISLNVEKMAGIVEKLISICYDSEGTCYDKKYANASGNTNYLGVEKLAAGTTLFAVAMIDSGNLYLRETKHDYGILPYPKWNEEQSDYYVNVDAGFTAMAVPKTVTDTERAGIITEALCAETFRSVVPVYYETALKQKGARNAESIEMMDFIMSKRVYDFGLVYDGGKGFYYALSSLVMDNNPNFASYYASHIDKVQAYFDSVFAVFN